MKKLGWLLLLVGSFCNAQKLKKADKQLLSNLQSHVNFLADDKLEGRRTGTKGETLAYNYIIEQYQKAGLAPKGDNGTYLQAFEVVEGKQVNPSTHLIINTIDLKLNKEYFPLACSPNATSTATAAVALHETNAPWFLDIKELLQTNKNNPHFDVKEAIKTHANEITNKGAAALIVFNGADIEDGLKFEANSKEPTLKIPVFYVLQDMAKKLFADETAILDIQLKTVIEQKKRIGHNVVAFKNNNAANTIIIGAHYDHLGFGEDHNSLFAGPQPQIHNGADDNASGTAAIIELAKLLSSSSLSNNNYLFVSFSGEELGLYGSKYFTENSTINLNNANCMINLDMVGRLNDSTHGITIGGFGTSPTWGQVINTNHKYFTIKLDSSGTGPSDHTSFYRKNIPVLFFFTGIHSDYHKPSDDVDKINFVGTTQIVKYIYNIIEQVNDQQQKLVFTKTKEMATSAKTSFKVTLGIMPDYTFSGNGVRADGVSEGKLAQKIGIKAGDVLVQMGEYKFSDVQSYMEVLSKFKKGDATKITVIRGKEEIVFDAVL